MYGTLSKALPLAVMDSLHELWPESKLEVNDNVFNTNWSIVMFCEAPNTLGQYINMFSIIDLLLKAKS